MPVTLHLSLKYNNDKYAQEKDESVMKISRFMWGDELANDFNNMLCSDEMQGQMEMAIDMISVDVNEALNVFNGCIKTAAKCMEKQIVVGDNEKKSD